MLQNRILEFLEDEPGKVAVLVENLDGNRLVEIEADRVFPSASTIKLAIMLTLFNDCLLYTSVFDSPLGA